ncbi:MAG: glycoside hydrolase family 44 protein [Thermoanaerobaculia bacterium]
MSALGGARLGSAAPLVIYDSQLRNGFVDYSWATHTLSQTAVVHSDTAAASFEPDGFKGFYLHRDAGLVVGTYDAIEFWIHGGTVGGQAVRIDLQIGGSPAGGGMLNTFITGGTIPANAWAKVRVPFASLGVTSGTLDGFWLQDTTGGDQSVVYVDDFIATEGAGPVNGTDITVAVDPNADRHAISPNIYGVSHFDGAGDSQLSYPVRRWGGNAVTRYNWKLDISNRASDYLFLNIPGPVANPGLLPDGSSSDLWIDSTRAHQGEPVLTIPTIGWTPKGTLATRNTQIWGMSIAKYGPQQASECDINFYVGCRADAGNGCAPGPFPGPCNTFTPAVPFDPTDTSDPVTPAYGVEWMDHIASRIGVGSLKYIILDNEPGLWNSTHRDVHQNALTYDELWTKSRNSAIAFKAKDPNVKILGPASYGWCEYFFSPADGTLYPGCQVGPDRTNHGGLEATAYFLQQAEAYRVANGVRLIDYLDLHYYPQASGIYNGTEAAAAIRLRSLKSLYDPTYVDESYIGEAVRLIPRMKDWVNTYAPGTKLAIGEYNWGDQGTSSALAQGEALAIFGREGLDMANRWTVPAANTLLEDSFSMYLNYDGAGAKVSGESIRAISSNIDAVGAYAVRGTSNYYFLLFNKDTAPRPTTVTVAGGSSLSAQLYRYDGSNRLAAVPGTIAPAAGSYTLTLPARSATLAVVPYVVVPPPVAAYYALTPCRIVDTRNATGPLGGPALVSAAQRTFTLTGQCGVPATATSVAANVTVVSPASTGAFRFFPANQSLPITSTVSFLAGRTRANNSLLGLSTDATGRVTVQNDAGTAHLLIDVNGYFQ